MARYSWSWKDYERQFGKASEPVEKINTDLPAPAPLPEEESREAASDVPAPGPAAEATVGERPAETAARNSTGSWSDEQVERLIHLWNVEKWSASLIAGEFDVSRDAIVGKVWRLRKAGVEMRSDPSKLTAQRGASPGGRKRRPKSAKPVVAPTISKPVQESKAKAPFNGFFPRRRKAAQPGISPDLRAEIDARIAAGEVTKCPPGWAFGADDRQYAFGPKMLGGMAE